MCPVSLSFLFYIHSRYLTSGESHGIPLAGSRMFFYMSLLKVNYSQEWGAKLEGPSTGHTTPDTGHKIKILS